MGDENSTPVYLTTTSGNLKFPCPKNFDGKDESWDLFQYKFRAYMNLANPKFKTLFEMAQSAGSTPVDLELELPEVEQLSTMLQNALIALCDGPAAKIVQRQDLSENGLESWRQLYNRYSPSKRSKATGRMMKILTWKFNMDQFENSFNEWEAEIAKYDSEQVTPFSDEVKIGVLYLRTSGPLYNHLLLNTDLSMPYNEIKTIIVNYFGTGRLLRDVRHHSSQQGSDGPTPMEIDAIWRAIKGKSKGKGKGGKSKGKESKGKGKGKSKDKGKSSNSKGYKGSKGKSKGKGKSCKGGKSNNSSSSYSGSSHFGSNSWDQRGGQHQGFHPRVASILEWLQGDWSEWKDEAWDQDWSSDQWSWDESWSNEDWDSTGGQWTWQEAQAQEGTWVYQEASKPAQAQQGQQAASTSGATSTPITLIPPQPVQPARVAILRGSSPPRSVSRLAAINMITNEDSNVDKIRDKICAALLYDDIYMVIDSGAAVHCAYPSFASDYPLLPLEDQRLLVNASGKSIKQYGIRCVLIEFAPGVYIWKKFKVCDVSHVYLSVPGMRRQGHHTVFADELYMKFNGDGESYKVPFEDSIDHFHVKPLRIVSFEESQQLGQPSEFAPEGQQEEQHLCTVTQSAKGVPVTSGRADFWRFNGKL